MRHPYLRFSGAERIAVLAYGKTTHLSAQGDWRSPGFDGGIPAGQPEHIRTAALRRSGLCPSSHAACAPKAQATAINGLDATALGISFIEVADPYQSVNRSLKYVLLFLGLVFLSYFIFEVTTGKRVHPAQYVLVGIAQIIFYLLLLSFAERIGFDYGFPARWRGHCDSAFGQCWLGILEPATGLAGSVIFTLLYVLIYLLLRLEDNALAGRRDRQLPGSRRSHVLHSQNRLVQLSSRNGAAEQVDANGLQDPA